MNVSIEIRIKIVEQNLEIDEQQLYSLDLKSRVANRTNNKKLIQDVSTDMENVLAAQDVYKEELTNLEKERNENT